MIRVLYSPNRTGAHYGWVSPNIGLGVYVNYAPAGFRSPDCPARSELLYWLSYFGRTCSCMPNRCTEMKLKLVGLLKCTKLSENDDIHYQDSDVNRHPVCLADIRFACGNCKATTRILIEYLISGTFGNLQILWEAAKQLLGFEIFLRTKMYFLLSY